MLLGERESEIVDELRRFSPELSRALAQDLPTGRLRPETLAALEAQVDRVIELLKEGQVSLGLVRLGGLLRIPADLSDPVLAVGPEGWPPGLTREYYALFEPNLDRIPVVLDDRAALEITRADVPAYWQSLLDRSRSQVPVVREDICQAEAVLGKAESLLETSKNSCSTSSNPVHRMSEEQRSGHRRTVDLGGVEKVSIDKHVVKA